jgi:tellurite resistance protein
MRQSNHMQILDQSKISFDPKRDTIQGLQATCATISYSYDILEASDSPRVVTMPRRGRDMHIHCTAESPGVMANKSSRGVSYDGLP